MVKVYNKETGALVWNGADDQVPMQLGVGDRLSFVEDVYVVEDLQGQGTERTIFVRHLKR